MATHRLEEPSMGRLGMVSFAAMIMMLVGVFQILQGLAAIFNSNFYILGKSYIYNINITTWGWIHLTLGVIIALAGVYVLSGKGWARVVGILMALASAVANFFFIPYYPVWALLIIALDIGVIWALAGYTPETAVE